jgi:hypothetical protein
MIYFSESDDSDEGYWILVSLRFHSVSIFIYTLPFFIFANQCMIVASRNEREKENNYIQINS